MTDARKENNVTIERHAQTVGIGLITLALAWGGSTMRQMYDAQIAQKVAIDNIQNSMVDLKADIKDVRDQLAEVDARFKDVPTNREVDARFDSVVQRLNSLERSDNVRPVRAR